MTAISKDDIIVVATTTYYLHVYKMDAATKKWTVIQTTPNAIKYVECPLSTFNNHIIRPNFMKTRVLLNVLDESGLDINDTQIVSRNVSLVTDLEFPSADVVILGDYGKRQVLVYKRVNKRWKLTQEILPSQDSWGDEGTTSSV